MSAATPESPPEQVRTPSPGPPPAAAWPGRAAGVAARRAALGAAAGLAAPARAADPRARHRQRLGQLEQVVHVLGPRAAGLLHERAEDALIARDRAGVGGRGGRAGGGRADLEHGDADPALRRPRERRGERGAVAVGLEEERDRPHLGLLDERGEQVGGGDQRLVADRGDGVESQPAVDGQRVDGHVAALRDQRHPARGPRAQRVAPERGARVEGDQPVAVRAEQRHGAGRRAQLVLQRAPAGLGEPGREDDGGAAAPRAGRAHDRGHAGRRDRDRDRIHRLGEILERRHARPPVDLAAGRVHGPHGPGKAERRQVAQRGVPVGARALRGSDDRDRARMQQRGDVHR